MIKGSLMPCFLVCALTIVKITCGLCGSLAFQEVTEGGRSFLFIFTLYSIQIIEMISQSPRGYLPYCCYLRYSSMMGSYSGQRDRQGVLRGPCQYECRCKLFTLDRGNQNNVSCAYCGHLPITHDDLEYTPRPLNRIRFYNRNEPYYEFTNFAEGFEIEDPDYHPSPEHKHGSPLLWPTSEHYFQAQKFTNDTQIMETIRKSKDARDAFTYARKYINFQDNDWMERNVDAMKKALRLKFRQHWFLKDLLIKTGNAELIEHTINDAFWGDGGDGRGQNMLGRLLGELRTDLKREEEKQSEKTRPEGRDRDRRKSDPFRS